FGLLVVCPIGFCPGSLSVGASAPCIGFSLRFSALGSRQLIGLLAPLRDHAGIFGVLLGCTSVLHDEFGIGLFRLQLLGLTQRTLCGGETIRGVRLGIRRLGHGDRVLGLVDLDDRFVTAHRNFLAVLIGLRLFLHLPGIITVPHKFWLGLNGLDLSDGIRADAVFQSHHLARLLDRRIGLGRDNHRERLQVS